MYQCKLSDQVYDKDVVVVGSCMIDLISYAPRLPVSGETLHGSKFVVGFGGKGANQCVAARKLGCNCALVARLGADSFGRDYRSYLGGLGIPLTHVQLTEGVSSGMAQIIVADSGENQIVIVAGANERLCAEDVLKARADIENCVVLITQMEVPMEATLEALRIKKDGQIGLSIFNAAPAQKSLPPELYSLPTIFCVNETEAQLLTGISVTSPEDAYNAAATLRGRGCQHVIITLGGQGAVYARPQFPPEYIPVELEKIEVVDTTGAGDSFIGALAYFITRLPQVTWSDAIRRACAVAAVSVQSPGTQTSFPTQPQAPVYLFTA